MFQQQPEGGYTTDPAIIDRAYRQAYSVAKSPNRSIDTLNRIVARHTGNPDPCKQAARQAALDVLHARALGQDA